MKEGKFWSPFKACNSELFHLYIAAELLKAYTHANNSKE